MTGTPNRRERGVALLIVLWALIPLSVLFLTLSATARSEAQAAADLRTASVLEAAADGAIHTAIFGLLSQGGASAAAPASVIQAARAGVTVETAALSGYVNPNTASPELLQALLARLGADPASAKQVAAAIVDWRTPGQRAGAPGAKSVEYRRAGLDYGPPGAPFESFDELGLVRGMNPALLAALAPVLSLYAYGDPDPQAASPAVRQALRDTGVFRSPGPLATQVFQVTALATGTAGTRAVRRAIVRIGPSPDGRGWRALAWGTLQGQ
jgi:general secretion pathway protein K